MFKVGDKVRIKDNLREIDGFSGGYVRELDKYIGNVVTIERIDEDEVFVEENGWVWDLRAFKKIGGDNMKKADLKIGDIVTLRNKDKLILVRNNGFVDILDENSNPIHGLSQFGEDLMYDYSRREYDIVKVERPAEYKTVFEREEVQELTVDEISERLGYKVKVVGEDR